MVKTITLVTVDWNNRINFRQHEAVLQSDYSSVKSTIRQLKSNSLVDGDKVYFAKCSKVPRYKFSEYCKDKKTTKVVKPENATAVVLDFDALFNGFEGSTNTTDLLEVPKTALVGYSNHGLPDIVYAYEHQLKNFDRLIKDFSKGYYTKAKHMIMNHYRFAEAKTALQDILNIGKMAATTKVLSDDTVLGEINQGIELTDDIYKQLQAMLSSSDQQNVALGMELMANSDYRKSELKIALLLNQYYDKYMIRNKNRNLVNFKSLLKYFDKYKWSADTLRFSESIIKTTRDDMPDKEERIRLAKQNVVDHLNGMIKGTRFSIENVVFK
jgi:hypothetical protein